MHCSDIAASFLPAVSPDLFQNDSKTETPSVPIGGDEVHAEHDALLCVLPAVGGDHHHVAGYLRVGALQTHSLQRKGGRR